jgi:hypothetical protein
MFSALLNEKEITMAYEIAPNTPPQAVKGHLQNQIQVLEATVEAYKKSFKKTLKAVEEAIKKEPANPTYPKLRELLQKEFAKNMENSLRNIFTMEAQIRDIENVGPRQQALHY